MAERTYSDQGEYEASPEVFTEIQQAWNQKHQEIVAQEEAADIAEFQTQEAAPTPAPPVAKEPQTFEQAAAKILAKEEAPAPAEAPPAPAPAKESAAELLAKAREEAKRFEEARKYQQYEQEAKRYKEEKEQLLGRLAKKDPAVLRELGIDPIEYANSAYAEALGDQAPEDFKKKLDQTDVRSEIAALRQEIERRDREREEQAQLAQQQAYVQQYDQQLIAAVQNPPQQGYETFTRAAKKSPQVAYQALVDATTAYFKESGGRFPSQEVAMQIAEAALGEIRAALLDEDTTIAKTPAKESKESELRKPQLTRTLSDTDTAERTSRREEIHDPMDFDYWAKQGVNEILRKRAQRK